MALWLSWTALISENRQSYAVSQVMFGEQCGWSSKKQNNKVSTSHGISIVRIISKLLIISENYEVIKPGKTVWNFPLWFGNSCLDDKAGRYGTFHVCWFSLVISLLMNIPTQWVNRDTESNFFNVSSEQMIWRVMSKFFKLQLPFAVWFGIRWKFHSVRRFH